MSRLISKQLEAMTTQELLDLAESDPNNSSRNTQILRVLRDRNAQTRKNIEWAISRLGQNVQAYLDQIGVTIPDDDMDNENEDPILLDENVGEQDPNWGKY